VAGLIFQFYHILVLFEDVAAAGLQSAIIETRGGRRKM
jgi:hypothetical protein